MCGAGRGASSDTRRNHAMPWPACHGDMHCARHSTGSARCPSESGMDSDGGSWAGGNEGLWCLKNWSKNRTGQGCEIVWLSTGDWYSLCQMTRPITW